MQCHYLRTVLPPCSRELLIPALFMGHCHSKEDVEWRWSGLTRSYPCCWPNTASLLLSPNTILFALAIFKHICRWSLELTVNLSLATRNPQLFKMDDCGAGKDSFCSSVRWLGAAYGGCGSHLLPSKSAKGNELLQVRGFLSFLLTSGLELVRRR